YRFVRSEEGLKGTIGKLAKKEAEGTLGHFGKVRLKSARAAANARGIQLDGPVENIVTRVRNAFKLPATNATKN
ncbi:MAG: hypothetical protein AB7P76_05045, partial [Candidatus Melainabacteria bacterium]